jgi:hypothetical protein
MRKIGKALLAASAAEQENIAAAPISRPSKAAPAVQRAQFNDRAQKLFAARPDSMAPVTASAVQLIGMRHIQADLGDAWPLIATKAYDVTERVIRQKLTDDDFYTRQDDENYVLCFARLNKREAAQMTQAIVDEITIELLREVPEASKLQVGHHVTEVTSAEAFQEADHFLMLLPHRSKLSSGKPRKHMNGIGVCFLKTPLSSSARSGALLDSVSCSIAACSTI